MGMTMMKDECDSKNPSPHFYHKKGERLGITCTANMKSISNDQPFVKRMEKIRVGIC